MALVGEAITQWSFVEQTLCNIFIVCVTSCPVRPPKMEGDPGLVTMIDSEVPTAIFYSTESFRGKLSLTNAALRTRVKENGQWAEQIRADWSKLHDKVRKLSLKRNSLAHGTVTPAFDDGDQFHEAQLMPPYGSPDWWTETGLRPQGKRKSPEQMRHLVKAFCLLDEKLRSFYKELGLHPRLHGKYDQLTVRQIRTHRRLDPKRAEWIERQLSSQEKF